MPGTTIQVKHVPATKEPTDNEETIKNIDSFWMSSARIGARLSRLLRTRKKIGYRNIIILLRIGHKMKCPLIF